MWQINLLEKREQEKVKMEIIILNIRSMLSLIVLVTSIIAIIFSVSNTLLKSEWVELFVSSALVQPKNTKLNNELNELAILLNQAESVQKDFWSLRNILINVSQLTPPGNTLYSLAMNKNTKIIDLTGFSLTRDDLLVFQKKLEDSQLFSEIRSPLANLFKKENINFQFQAVLK